MTRRVVAIIPARGGSKGIPGKNIRLVGGLPLIAHSILHCKAVPEIAATYVSTDDLEIAAVARRYGAEVIDRPASLANDTASSESALVHALGVLAARGMVEIDAVVFLQATSPRRQPDDLPRALQTFWSQEADSLFSATAATGFLWRVGASGPAPLNYDPVHRPRRQDAPEDVIENGSFYIFRPSVLSKHGSRLGGRIAVHRMRAEDSFQIDEPFDLELMEMLFARERGAASPSAPGAGPRREGVTAHGQLPTPADLGYFGRREPVGTPDYEASYWGDVVDPDGNRRDRTKEREQHVADLAAELAFIRALPPGRVLDVGCGLGFTLSGIPDAWEKHGVEVSGFAAERARAYGKIHHGELAGAGYPAGYFDVVILHHVIEHVDEPLALLRQVIHVLKPGGKLVLGTPDFDSAMARRFGEKYRLLHDPTHVSLFTVESMHRVLRDHGLVIERVDYPYFESRFFTKDNLLRVMDTSQLSPAFYGSFMTFYCTKPVHHETRASFIKLAAKSREVAETLDEAIVRAGSALADCIANGNKILAAGNGGSAADAQHFVAELIGRLKIERRSLPGISLSSDPSVVTCLANDYGYDQLFARQVEGLGKPGDVLLAISTSGRSPNVLNAARVARASGITVVSLIGEKGGPLEELSHHCVRIPSAETQVIQELHMAVLHVLCAAIDQRVVK